MLNCWTDGSVIGGAWGKKTGPKTTPRNYVGWLVRRPTGEYVDHLSFYMGEGDAMTGNTAEHFAVNSLLRSLLRSGHKGQALTIHLDSQLVVGHLSGGFAVHNPVLVRFTEATRKLMTQFPAVILRWIPRAENKIADRLSKALQEKFEGRPLTRAEVEALF